MENERETNFIFNYHSWFRDVIYAEVSFCFPSLKLNSELHQMIFFSFSFQHYNAFILVTFRELHSLIYVAVKVLGGLIRCNSVRYVDPATLLPYLWCRINVDKSLYKSLYDWVYCIFASLILNCHTLWVIILLTYQFTTEFSYLINKPLIYNIVEQNFNESRVISSIDVLL